MLNVVIENSGKAAILHCSGRLVAGEEAWTLFNTVVALKKKRVVVLDLRRVSRADARGLGVLVFLKKWARGAGVKLQLIPSKTLQELLDLTGLGSEFEIRSPESIPSGADLLSGAQDRGTSEGRCA